MQRSGSVPWLRVDIFSPATRSNGRGNGNTFSSGVEKRIASYGWRSPGFSKHVSAWSVGGVLFQLTSPTPYTFNLSRAVVTHLTTTRKPIAIYTTITGLDLIVRQYCWSISKSLRCELWYLQRSRCGHPFPPTLRMSCHLAGYPETTISSRRPHQQRIMIHPGELIDKASVFPHPRKPHPAQSSLTRWQPCLSHVGQTHRGLGTTDTTNA